MSTKAQFICSIVLLPVCLFCGIINIVAALNTGEVPVWRAINLISAIVMGYWVYHWTKEIGITGAKLLNGIR